MLKSCTMTKVEERRIWVILCGCCGRVDKALASTSGYWSLCFVQWLCRSVCGSEDRVFEPRLGKRDLCTYDLHKGLALLTLNSHTLHDTVTTARLLL